jgi:hypothetical protein
MSITSQEISLDNISAALEQSDRICRLEMFDIFPRQTEERVLATLQRPFPALTFLLLQLENAAPTISNSFLGGPAPRLQTLFLDRVPLPGLPKLLLSTTHLVHLTLCRIPRSGYVSPEAMITGLSALTRLEALDIGFHSPRYRPDRKGRRRRPPTRARLPILTHLQLTGIGRYLDDLVA